MTTNADVHKPYYYYIIIQEHLPYADDSTAVTPKSELNGGIVVDTPTKMGLSRLFPSKKITLYLKMNIC